MNYLRHAAASGGTIPVMELFVSDEGNPQSLRVQFNNTRIVSVDDGATANGGGVGKTSINDIRMVVRVVKASPMLMLRCATGEHINKK